MAEGEIIEVNKFVTYIQNVAYAFHRHLDNI